MIRFLPRHTIVPRVKSSIGICGSALISTSLIQRFYSMTATKIDGTAIAKTIREKIAKEIAEKQSKNPRYVPSLTILQIGQRSDSTSYVRMKLKAAEEAKIHCHLESLPEGITEAELLEKIEAINNDSHVHGLLIQLPLPSHLDEYKITSAVNEEKDVDGFGTKSIGELAKRSGNPAFVPCTPQGIMVLLKESGVEIKGKNAVVLGRSDIVGAPVSYLLRDQDATVTTCHSKTQNIEAIVKQADIVVAAIGKANFVKGEWLKEGAVVIDVGTNFVDDTTKKSGQRLVGDVDYESASQVASQITPVPGGVGPMTVAMLLSNVVNAADAYFDRAKHRHVSLLPLKLQSPVPSDDAISKAHKPKPITKLAAEIGIASHELEPYGFYMAKVSTNILDRLQHRRNGKYVVMTGITPTPLGEGKSTTTIGLAQALTVLGRPSIATIRQGSQGPTFGTKGGAAGGGYSLVQPMSTFNMHMTSDIHCVTAATNLLAAAIDTRMFHEGTQSDGALYKRLTPAKKGTRAFLPVMLRRLQKLGIEKTNPEELTPEEITRFVRLDIDPDTITWRRVLDVNDRHLRGITINQAPTESKAIPRSTGFDISVASECMAVLALSTSLADMRDRLRRMVVASSKAGEPITADDLGVAGAVAALMITTIQPTLMQTLEGSAALIHAGPFANISIGNSSIIADRIALKLAGTEADEDPAEQGGFVITEAGFDFTMGGERFMNIKCRASGLIPDVVCIVATVRALKVHGGGPKITPGSALPEAYRTENVEMLRKGCVNLKKHIENARQYGVNVVVAINKFETDTQAEVEALREEAISAGATDAVLADHWAKGGAGALDLAKSIITAANKSKPEEFKFLYGTDGTVQDRIEAIAKKMYGADGIELSEAAQVKVDTYTRQGFGHLPICIAKTQYSLSHDPELKGAPTGFTLPIRDVRLAAGAGYLFALCGEIQTIPGLPTLPGFFNVDINPETNEIDGLF